MKRIRLSGPRLPFRYGLPVAPVLLLLTALLSACHHAPNRPVSAPSAPSSVAAPLVGGDRDAHGCIGSAGYSWCARQNACVRPWELAAEKGFAVDAQAFERYCAGK